MSNNIARIEKKLLVISSDVGAPNYDFDFNLYFNCEHPFRFQDGELCVLRIGPISNYAEVAASKSEMGLKLVNSPSEHHRASEIDGWYSLISDITPATSVFDELPSATHVETEFGWPVFIKGSRQTSKHNSNLSIANDSDDYIKLCKGYKNDPILHWQRPVIRQFVSLQPIRGKVPGKIQPSLEFRTFWWRGVLVGWGQYWYQLPAYRAEDIDDGLAVAHEAARRLGVPFLVVDIARTIDGGWLVIECNDAQEAGYAGLTPHVLWRNIIERV